MPLVLAILLLLVFAAPASAGPILDKAAQELQSDPVYVDPDAEADLSSREADAVRQRIQARDAAPMFIAVLPAAAPDDAGGKPHRALVQLATALNRRGTYVLVTGNTLRAGSQDPAIPRGATASAATAAVQANGADGLSAILLDLVDRMGAIRGQGAVPDSGSGDSGGSGGPPFADGNGDNGDGGGIGGGALLIGALAIGGGVFALSRRRKRREGASEFEEAKDNARDDLVALGEDIRALDIDVELPKTPQAGKDDYATAVSAYQRAEEAWDRARRPEDLAGVGEALEEGRWAMASAKARQEGRQPPERRPPCFFDPRHGPSSRDVEWSPPYGAPRLVPACEADAQHVERGEDPEAREVLVGGRRMPYWDAGPMYAPYAGGFFGGFGGGLLPGLLMGSML